MPSPWKRPRLDDLPLYLILAGMVFAILGRALSGFEYDIFEDDAYYYSIMARNIATLHISTFDGTSHTNGAHPLLLSVQVLLAAILGPGASPARFYTTLIVLYTVILLAFAFALALLWRRLARTEEGRALSYAFALAVGYLFLPGHIHLFDQGMESILAFPLTAVLLILLYLRRERAAGLIGALLVASRLDTFVFVLLPLSAFYALTGPREVGWMRRAVSRAIGLALPASVFVVVYMLYNRLQFGEALPIHGALKSSFPHVHFRIANLVGLGHGWTSWIQQHPFRCLVAGIVAGILLFRRGKLSPDARRVGIALLLVTATELGNLLLFQKWGKPMTSWYLWLPLFTSSGALALGLAHVLPRWTLRLVAFGLGSVLFVLAGLDTGRKAGRAALHPHRLAAGQTEVARFIRTTPQGALWAHTDCGRVSFWGERRFVNLDGLVNDYAYQKRIRDGELSEYLKERGVRYLVAVFWDRPQRLGQEYEPMYKCRVAPDAFAGNYEDFHFFVYSYLYGKYSDEILLPRESEIWRSAPFRDGRAQTRLAVYDLSLARSGGRPDSIGAE